MPNNYCFYFKYQGKMYLEQSKKQKFIRVEANYFSLVRRKFHDLLVVYLPSTVPSFFTQNSKVINDK